MTALLDKTVAVLKACAGDLDRAAKKLKKDRHVVYTLLRRHKQHHLIIWPEKEPLASEQALIAAFKKHKTFGGAAKAVGVSRDYATRVLKPLGLVSRGTKIKHDRLEKRNAELVAMYEQRVPLVEIMEHFELSESGVNRILRQCKVHRAPVMRQDSELLDEVRSMLAAGCSRTKVAVTLRGCGIGWRTIKKIAAEQKESP